jgi:hypothetical protein
MTTFDHHSTGYFFYPPPILQRTQILNPYSFYNFLPVHWPDFFADFIYVQIEDLFAGQ